jgi:hypothetical protein
MSFDDLGEFEFGQIEASPSAFVGPPTRLALGATALAGLAVISLAFSLWFAYILSIIVSISCIFVIITDENRQSNSNYARTVSIEWWMRIVRGLVFVAALVAILLLAFEAAK